MKYKPGTGMNSLIFVNLNQTITTKESSENKNKTWTNQFKHLRREYSTQTNNTKPSLAYLVLWSSGLRTLQDI
jgi:hypothetical protein